MAKNDIILIDGIIDERVAKLVPSGDRGDAFEYFASEQIIKEYDLSPEEILSGLVDGRNDGGIDYFYIFINGHLLVDSDAFQYPKSGAEIDVYIMSCKHQDSFKLQPIDSLYASLCELLDFSLKSDDFKADYNEELLEMRDNLYNTYRKLAGHLTRFTIRVIYASRGNTSLIGENVEARSRQVQALLISNFSECLGEFLFVGSTELLTMYRKVRISDLELQIDKSFSKGTSYVVLTKLTDYYHFITDEQGKLRMYLFDSNVRDFMGLNRVNQDILDTLHTDTLTDFWLYNNGITILVTDAHNVGDMMNMKSIQIVNGLQTSQTIYSFFSSGNCDENNRDILIKIIKSEDKTVRDNIIRATNNQTHIGLQSLHATDKIQRDIEDIMLINGLYYERRVKLYANQGIANDLIFSPLYLAAGYMSLVMKIPYRAATLKSGFMNIPEQYELVYNQDIDLNIWPKIARILKATDEYLTTVRSSINTGEKFYKITRQLLSFFTISILLHKFSFSATELISFNIEEYNIDAMKKAWMLIRKSIDSKDVRSLTKKNCFVNICSCCVEENGINDLEFINRVTNPFVYDIIFKLDNEFLDKIDSLLPDQPWKKGIHIAISQQLKCHPDKVAQAITELIESGKRNPQINGIICGDLNNRK